MTGIDERQGALLQLFTDVDGGVLAALKNDGRPQLSDVIHTYDIRTYDIHTYDPKRRIILVSVTDDRVRTCNLRRGPCPGSSKRLRVERAYGQRRQHS